MACRLRAEGVLQIFSLCAEGLQIPCCTPAEGLQPACRRGAVAMLHLIYQRAATMLKSI
jgi:hypothetical protein